MCVVVGVGRVGGVPVKSEVARWPVEGLQGERVCVYFVVGDWLCVTVRDRVCVCVCFGGGLVVVSQ